MQTIKISLEVIPYIYENLFEDFYTCECVYRYFHDFAILFLRINLPYTNYKYQFGDALHLPRE